MFYCSSNQTKIYPPMSFDVYNHAIIPKFNTRGQLSFRSIISDREESVRLTHRPLDHEDFRVALPSFKVARIGRSVGLLQANQAGPGGAVAVEPVPIAATWQPTSLPARPKRPFQKCRSRGRLDVYK
ncbi:unnamed protein product [Heterotrigona itama]|uniref:Uncharacterized protein n=1 Tax=Heterotrigona itama TaxID=395501 RepID=A0A6V7H0P0_9HYME|nr:unnamed protein product [Heterotrigona itama]